MDALQVLQAFQQLAPPLGILEGGDDTLQRLLEGLGVMLLLILRGGHQARQIDRLRLSGRHGQQPGGKTQQESKQ